MPDDDVPAPLDTPRLEAIRAPIPGDAPAGIDMAYEDAYQALKAEVDAMGAATGGVDFDTIVDRATEILSTRSKDISAACYLAFGLTRTDGFSGLAEGIGAVRAVAETFWEGAFPPLRRMRARQAAMQFMAERLGAWTESQKATPDDRKALEHALVEASALQEFTVEAMGDDAPSLSGLTRTIREALRRLPVPTPAEPDSPPAPPPAPGASEGPAPARPASPSPAPPSAPAVSVGGDASFGTPAEALAVALRVAGFLREQNALDAAAVALTRAVQWGVVPQAPPADGGRTRLPAPPQARRDALAGMVASGNHEVLVRAGEGAFQEASFRFCLDLQRLLATAFGALGAPAQAARAAVEEATAGLVRRLPTLATLAFADGTPFADAQTVAWLDEISASGDGGGSGAAPAGAAEQAIAEAQARARSGDVPGAVGALVAGAGAPRDRFERGLVAAEMCLVAGRPDVALALLDDADAAVRLHRLDVWDTEAARKALRLLHSACTALQANAAPPDRKAALAARADDSFARLARLDPGMAMRTAAPPKKA